LRAEVAWKEGVPDDEATVEHSAEESGSVLTSQLFLLFFQLRRREPHGLILDREQLVLGVQAKRISGGNAAWRSPVEWRLEKTLDTLIFNQFYQIEARGLFSLMRVFSLIARLVR